MSVPARQLPTGELACENQIGPETDGPDIQPRVNPTAETFPQEPS
jgi:hypothetical protein